MSKIFSDLDEDKDGKLSYDEIIKAFEKSGRSHYRSAQLTDKVLNELRLSKNEGIELNHFYSICCKKQKMNNENFLQNGFE